MEREQILGDKPEHPPPQARLHEIRNAENSAAFLLPYLQSMKASNPNLKLLDCGAGSGTISVSFAKLIPEGHVIGVDVNESILPRARANAQTAGISNIEFFNMIQHELMLYMQVMLTRNGNVNTSTSECSQSSLDTSSTTSLER